jgi:glutathione S-transferase
MLELYQKEDCPYCRKVREALTALDLDYICRNVRAKDSKKQSLLLKLGGKAQVPFLVDTERDRRMYESDDIVQYLNEQYG